MNGLFIVDLALYILLLPFTLYNLFTHRWTGFLGWYYLSAFCAVRIVGGAMGVNDHNSLVANILTGVGTSPLVLAVDGLLHEARVYRDPNHNRAPTWFIIWMATTLSAAGVALTIKGALDIYNSHPKDNSLTLWEVGVALVVVTWAMEVVWALFSLSPFQARRDAPLYKNGAMLLHAALVALIFVGVRVVYALVAVCTQRRDLSPVYGTTVVRVVLMFLPEAIAAIVMVFAGFRTRPRQRKA